MNNRPMVTPPVDFFEVVTITAGTTHENVVPTPPEGRKVERIWTVIDLKKLAEIGPVHNVSAFLEDNFNDYRFNDAGQLRYYSRVAETNKPVEIVLDYATTNERRARLGLPPQPPRPNRR